MSSAAGVSSLGCTPLNNALQLTPRLRVGDGVPIRAGARARLRGRVASFPTD